MRPSVPLILTILLCAAAVGGCGLKNDLYLPDPPKTQTDQDEQTQDEESP